MAASLVVRLCLAASIMLLSSGVTLAWGSVSFAKRVVGVLVALMGAIVGAAAIAAPQTMLMAGAAVLFCYAAVGVSVLARLQELYGSTEVADLDAADADAMPPEPAA